MLTIYSCLIIYLYSEKKVINLERGLFCHLCVQV